MSNATKLSKHENSICLTPTVLLKSVKSVTARTTDFNFNC